MVPCVAISLSFPFFLSLSVLAYSRSFSERWRPSLTRWSARASLARGAELYDATVVVTWLFRGSGLARRASVWSNVCYDGRRRRVRTGERSRKQRRDGKDHPRAATLVSRDNSADSLSVAGSVGVRNWLGLYAKRQSVFFSLLSALRQSATQHPFSALDIIMLPPFFGMCAVKLDRDPQNSRCHLPAFSIGKEKVVNNGDIRAFVYYIYLRFIGIWFTHT